MEKGGAIALLLFFIKMIIQDSRKPDIRRLLSIRSTKAIFHFAAYFIKYFIQHCFRLFFYHFGNFLVTVFQEFHERSRLRHLLFKLIFQFFHQCIAPRGNLPLIAFNMHFTFAKLRIRKSGNDTIYPVETFRGHCLCSIRKVFRSPVDIGIEGYKSIERIGAEAYPLNGCIFLRKIRANLYKT